MGAFDLNQCLSVEAARWVDTVDYAQDIVDRFTDAVDADLELKAHRDFVEVGGYGFGERAFHALWKLIIDETPREFSFLEIGVYKGQVLSLVRLLADRTGRDAQVVGVTPLSTFSGITGKFPEFPDVDYDIAILELHERFDQEQPRIIVGDSTDKWTQQTAAEVGPYDIVYIDGCHEYDYVVRDLRFYGNLLRLGGLLVVDDSACYLKQPQGFFKGIGDVSLAVLTIIETDRQWKHLLAVMHNRVWRRGI